MGKVITFPARAAAVRVTPELRAQLEDAAQRALDTADHIIAVLDRFDGDPDREDGGEAEPSLGAPDGHASQLAWLRGSDDDREEGRQPCV